MPSNKGKKDMRTLLAEYNALSGKSLTTWKKKRSLLEQMVEALRPKKEEARAARERAAPVGAIRQMVEALLQHVTGKTDEGRELGLTYAAILDEVARKYPGAETTLNCLRWYAAKLNKRKGVHMPVRPKPGRTA